MVKRESVFNCILVAMRVAIAIIGLEYIYYFLNVMFNLYSHRSSGISASEHFVFFCAVVCMLVFTIIFGDQGGYFDRLKPKKIIAYIFAIFFSGTLMMCMYNLSDALFFGWERTSLSTNLRVEIIGFLFFLVTYLILNKLKFFKDAISLPELIGLITGLWMASEINSIDITWNLYIRLDYSNLSENEWILIYSTVRQLLVEITSTGVLFIAYYFFALPKSGICKNNREACLKHTFSTFFAVIAGYSLYQFVQIIPFYNNGLFNYFKLGLDDYVYINPAPYIVSFVLMIFIATVIHGKESTVTRLTDSEDLS